MNVPMVMVVVLSYVSMKCQHSLVIATKVLNWMMTNCKCMYTSSMSCFWLISCIELKISQHYFHVMITVVIMRSYVVMCQALQSVPAELVMNWQKMRRHALVQNL